MAGSRDALLSRFAKLRTDISTRRADYKGERRRLNLRLSLTVMKRLQLIKVVSGVAKNAFCEKVIEEAVDKRVKELQAEYDTATWEALVRCAEAGER